MTGDDETRHSGCERPLGFRLRRHFPEHESAGLTNRSNRGLELPGGIASHRNTNQRRLEWSSRHPVRIPIENLRGEDLNSERTRRQSGEARKLPGGIPTRIGCEIKDPQGGCPAGCRDNTCSLKTFGCQRQKPWKGWVYHGMLLRFTVI
jgi:hypothetical protein